MTNSAGVRAGLGDCCSAFASTRPAVLPRTQRWHGAADRLLDATRPVLVPLMIGLAALATLVSDALPDRPALLVLALYFALAGGWCDLNLIRRREAHCLVTGLGWSALAVVAIVAAAIAPALIGYLWPAFLAILAVAVAFEAAWALGTGKTAITR